MKTYRTLLATCTAWCLIGATCLGADSVMRLGYFVAGDCPYHTALRGEFTHQLQLLLPEHISLEGNPRAYGNADWKRDSCRVLATYLTQVTDVDLMVCMGPWVVEDLLKAGYSRPILAMHRVDPHLEGLLGSTGRPIAENLTVQYSPGKIESDIKAILELKKVRRLGVLYFPTGNEADSLLARIRQVTAPANVEVVYGTGVDNFGTYAFFKAYGELGRDIDAVYILPLWGMDSQKCIDFFAGLADDRVPSVAWDGRVAVSQGAVIGNSGPSLAIEARFNAYKAVQIFEGASPADLPVVFEVPPSLCINQGNAERCRLRIPEETLLEATVANRVQPEPVNHYTLRQAMIRALDQNPDYLAQIEAVTEAVQSAKEAAADYLPQLDADLSFDRVDENTVYNSLDRVDKNQVSASLTLTQTLFSLEKLRSIQAAHIDRELTRSEQRRVRLELEQAVALAYLDYLTSRERWGEEVAARDEIDLLLEQSFAVYAVDSVGWADVLRWRQLREDATRRVAAAQAGCKIARVAMNALLNLEGGQPFELDDTGRYNESGFWGDYGRAKPLLDSEDRQRMALESLVTEGLAQSPAINSGRMQVALQRKLLSRNTGSFLPQVGFKARLRWADKLHDQPPAFYEEPTTWSLGIGAHLSLLDGTRRWHERYRLNAAISRAEYQRDAEALRLMRAVSTTFHLAVADARQAVRALRGADLITDARKREADRFLDVENGVGLLDMIDIVERERQATLDAINDRFRFYQQVIQLIGQVGWSLTENRLEPTELLWQRLNL